MGNNSGRTVKLLRKNTNLNEQYRSGALHRAEGSRDW